MIRRLFTPALLATLLLVGLGPIPAFAGTFIWTGVSGTGWQGNLTPPYDGTDDLILGKAINNTIPLAGDTFINSITMTGNDDYVFQGATPLNLTINNGPGNGINGAVGSFSRLTFDWNINLVGTGLLRMDAGDGFIVINSAIVGTTDLNLSNALGGTNGAFIFNNTGTGNTYTGDTFISGIVGTPVVVAFWNSQPFGDGTGTVYFDSSTALIAHGSQRVDNDLVFNTTVANDPIYLKAWDDTLCFDGDVTLANNTTLVAGRTPRGVNSADNTGVIPTPGPMSRNVIDFEDDIDDGGGGYMLTVNGPGVILLEGNNSYSGGTLVNGSGSLIFGSAISAPGINQVTANGGGYVGFADTTPGELVNFLTNKVDRVGSTGAIGIDTLPGQPTAIFSDPINLSGANGNLRIGSATSAILTGLITPQGAGNYKFGNGGGTLYVQSDLTGVGRTVFMNNTSVVPLTLYLQGNNSYTGGTFVNNGFVIFDFDAALPGGANSLTAAGVGSSYIGYTDAAAINAITFLGMFNRGATSGIIGFDTNATTFGATGATFITDNIDLSTFNPGVYLGTTTGAILTGTLTPTSDNIMRFTAAQGGTLTVDSVLGGTMAVSLGTFTGTPDVYSSGRVILAGPNSYTGGTTINSEGAGLTVEAGSNTAFGSGAIRLPQDVIAGLQASTFVNLFNPINFDTPAATHAPASLFLQGGIIFELSGSITGPGTINVMDPLNFVQVTLSGDNSAFSGDINIANGAELYLANNNAAGTGTVHFLSGGTLAIGTVIAPILYGISGSQGTIELNDFDMLKFDLSNPANSHEFGGTIGNETAPNASLTVTSSVSNDALYLYGNNNYSGGTTILSHGAVGVGNDSALGSGAVTLNAPQGGLAVNVGITLSNPLILTAGSLQGFGSFNPSSVNGTPGAPITIGTGLSVAPGLYNLSNNKVTGTLTFATGADFSNGGRMLWSIQDAARPDGYSSLLVDGGDLNISASGGGFMIFLASIDGNGNPGFAANLTPGTPYTFTIATVLSGFSLTNFNAGSFTIDTSLFANGVSGTPYLTSDATNIYLNFTPVPEPSTYALLGLGLSAVLFPVLRRRRRE